MSNQDGESRAVTTRAADRVQSIIERGDDIRQVYDGFQLHEADLRFPFVTLRQAQSEGPGHPGYFQRRDTGEEMQTLEVVPIFLRPTRLKWPAGAFRRDAKPECFSIDGRYGAPDGMYAGQLCIQCDFFKLQTRRGDREAGKCLNTYLLGAYDFASHETLLFRLTGTAVYVARTIVGSQRNPVGRRRVMRLYGKETTSDVGKWFQFTAELGRELSQEEREEADALFEEVELRGEELDEKFTDAMSQGEETASEAGGQRPINPQVQAAIDRKNAPPPPDDGYEPEMEAPPDAGRPVRRTPQREPVPAAQKPVPSQAVKKPEDPGGLGF